MAKYRLRAGKKHYEGGKLLEAGSVVEMDEARAEGLADRFEPVAGTPSAKATAPATKPTGGLGLADVNMPDAIDKVAKLDTAEALDAAEAEEKDGKDRKGVHDAIADRRAELAEGKS